MRLLYLSADPGVPVFGDKGASVHLRSLTGALHAAGHEVLVASPRLEPGRNPLAAGVATAAIPAVRPRECATPQEVRERCSAQAAAVSALVREHRLEGIYERFSLMGVAGARTRAELDVPLVLEVNAPLREEERRFRQLTHEELALSAERETFAAAARIFVVSGALRDWVIEQHVDPAAVEVVPNAPPARSFARHRPAGGADTLVVGFAGGLKRWHGIETLVDGFGRALADGGRLRLEIAGSGPGDEVLDRAELPDGSLRRHGAVSHQRALELLASWDVGVAPFIDLPGFYFSPLKLYEYMAAGLCPVVSDVGDLPAIVAHGRAGVITAPGDPQALAQALLALDADRVRTRELGAAACARARQLPGWEAAAQRVISALSAAARRPAATAGGRR